MKNNDWKDRLNVVYSTNPDFGYEMDNDGRTALLFLSLVLYWTDTREVCAR